MLLNKILIIIKTEYHRAELINELHCKIKPDRSTKTLNSRRNFHDLPDFTTTLQLTQLPKHIIETFIEVKLL